MLSICYFSDFLVKKFPGVFIFCFNIIRKSDITREKGNIYRQYGFLLRISVIDLRDSCH